MNARAITTLAIAWLACASAAHAQLTRDGRPVAIGSATLSGTVVSDDAEARPVRHARVTCSAPELTGGLTAITDDRGGFTCARLPAGRYTVRVSRDGWVPTVYGAKRALRPGTPVPVGAGQHVTVVIRLMRGAVITGALIDESGQPAIGASVVALRSMMQNGERHLVDAGTPSTTDDRGVYRIYGLPPGDYIVRAAPSSASLLQDVQATTDLDVRHARAAAANSPVPPDRRVAFAPTYFPGTPSSLQASPIPLRPSEERSEVDFALQLVATARVDGTVTMPDGSPASASTQITLMPSGQARLADAPLEGLKTTRAGSDGTFAFAGVPPGTYTVLARAATPGVVWGSTEIGVDGERISGLVLPLQPGLTIAGQVRVDGSGGSPPFDVTTIKIAAEPVQSIGDVALAPAPTAVDRSGRFVVNGVTPGQYRLTATIPAAGRSRGWMVRSAIANGLDTLDVPLTIAPGANVSDAVLTLTDRSAEIAGVLQDTAGRPASDYTIVVFSADPALWLPRARRIQATRPAADGAFAFRTLPAGDYLVGVVDDVESGEWFDPAFLQRLAPAAIHLTLADGERKTQNITLGPGSLE
jgi:uncharacterized protein (DUF2141 family)